MLELSVFPTISHEHTHIHTHKGARLILVSWRKFSTFRSTSPFYAWLHQYDCRLWNFLIMFMKAYVTGVLPNVVDHLIICSVTVRDESHFRKPFQHDEDIYENQNRGLFGSNIIKFTHMASCSFLFIAAPAELFVWKLRRLVRRSCYTRRCEDYAK